MYFPVLAVSGHYRPRFLVVDEDTHYEDKNKTKNVNKGETVIHKFSNQIRLLVTPNSPIKASQAFCCLCAGTSLRWKDRHHFLQGAFSTMDHTWQSLKGQFLMAMPGLGDPNFYQSVTCLSEHNQKGAMGIVITRIHPEINGKMIFDELRIPTASGAEKIPVHIGGPVHMNELFVLHGAPFTWEGSMMVTAEVALSNSLDILEAIAMGRGPAAFMIALGCAGWGPGQLESEIRNNAWITGPYSETIAFQMEVERRWEAAMQRLGIDPALLSDTAGHA
jgi:putative transcriptional regulator